MAHGIHRVTGFDIVAPYTLTIRFDDDTSRTINFRPVLEGEMFAPLQRLDVFNAVTLDREAHTLVWPNGADFDPETLHDCACDQKRHAINQLADGRSRVRIPLSPPVNPAFSEIDW